MRKHTIPVKASTITIFPMVPLQHWVIVGADLYVALPHSLIFTYSLSLIYCLLCARRQLGCCLRITAVNETGQILALMQLTFYKSPNSPIENSICSQKPAIFSGGWLDFPFCLLHLILSGVDYVLHCTAWPSWLNIFSIY